MLSKEKFERDQAFMREFEEAAKPLIKFYNEKCNPLIEEIVIDFYCARIEALRYSFPIREDKGEK